MAHVNGQGIASASTYSRERSEQYEEGTAVGTECGQKEDNRSYDHGSNHCENLSDRNTEVAPTLTAAIDAAIQNGSCWKFRTWQSTDRKTKPQAEQPEFRHLNFPGRGAENDHE